MAYKTGFYKGRLGIGLSNTMGMGDGNPRFPLDINGDIRITGSIVNEEGKAIISGGVGGSAMATRQQNTTEEPSWTDNAITVENIDGNLQITGQLLTDGNVGIGTTNPATKLHIGGMGNVLNLQATTRPSIFYYKGDPSIGLGSLKWVCGMNSEINENFEITSVNSAGHIILTPTGGVGIGTTSPFGKLDIKHSNWTQTPTASTMCDMLNLMVSSPSTTGEGNMRTLLCFADGYRNNSATKDSYRVRCRMSGAGFDMIWNSSATETLGANTTNNNFIFHRDYTAFMNKNVGIGTTSLNPTYDSVDTRANLHLVQSGGGIAFKATTTQTNSRNWRIRHDDYGPWGQLQFTCGETNADFGNSESDVVMCMTHEKRVGIGTTSPDSKLHVNGNITLDAVKTGNATGVGGGISFRAGADYAPDSSTGAYNCSILTYGHDPNTDGLSINGYDGVSFCTGSSTRNERMRIDSDGNVGIGTTNPGAPLEIYKKGWNDDEKGGAIILSRYAHGVDGVNNTSTPYRGSCIWHEYQGTPKKDSMCFASSSNANPYTLSPSMVLTNEGNVGIGTTSPTQKLQVDGNVGVKEWSSDGNTSMFCVGSDTNWGMKFVHSAGQYYTRFGIYGTGTHDRGFEFYDHNSVTPTRMFISGTGNVGIHTTSPLYTLDLNGNQRTSGYSIVENGNSSYTLYGPNTSWANYLFVGSGPRFATGNACVFNTTGNLHLDCANGAILYLNHYSQNEVRTPNGLVYSSDDRLKHNEEIIDNALEIIKKIKVKKYFKSGKLYDEDYNYELDSSGNPITDDKYQIETGFIAQEVMKVPELKYLVYETDNDAYDMKEVFKKDSSGNFILDEKGEKIKEKVKNLAVRGRYGLRYNDIFVMNVQATQELDKKITTIEDNNNLQINNTENIIGNISFVNGYTIVNNKKLYNNNISDKLYFNPETGKLNCPNIESTYYGDGSNLQGIATESQINDLIEENKKLKQDNENNKELINFWTQQAMNLNNKLTTMENELKIIKENLGL